MVSIVEARRNLGRLAEEVRRTRRPVVLTNRGRVVAAIAPEPNAIATRTGADAFAALRGTVEVIGSVDELERTIRSLRREFGRSLGRRSALLVPPARRNA